MTPIEYADKLRLALSEIERENKPLAIAAATMTAQMSERIFVNGQDVNNAPIGVYSKKGLYIGTDELRALKMAGQATGKGKPNKDGKASDTFKTGKKAGTKHRTTYFAGWEAVRKAAGKPTDVVNLDFIGDLKSDFAVSSLLRVDVHEYNIRFRSDENKNKALGNEDHFNKTIFTPSQQEKDKFFSTAEFELRKLLSGTGTA